MSFGLMSTTSRIATPGRVPITLFAKQRIPSIICRTTADRVSLPKDVDLKTLLHTFDADGDGRLTIAEVQQAIEVWQAGQPANNGTTSASPLPAGPSKTPPKVSGQATWDLQIVNGFLAAQERGQSPLLALLSYVSAKLSNTGKARASASDLLWSFCGMFLAVCALGVMNVYVRSWPVVGEWHQQGLGLLLGSFGTLCVLIFGRPEAEAVRLWNFLAGHVVATATVITLLHVLGPSILSRALAMACMIAVMLFTDSVHPPGGALVLMAVDSAAIQRMDWWFMLYPSLAITTAVLLPLGVAINWLKRNVKFDFPAESAAPPAASGSTSAPLELKPKMA